MEEATLNDIFSKRKLLVKILLCVAPSNIINCERVCRLWRSKILNGKIWMNFMIGKCPKSWSKCLYGSVNDPIYIGHLKAKTFCLRFLKHIQHHEMLVVLLSTFEKCFHLSHATDMMIEKLSESDQMEIYTFHHRQDDISSFHLKMTLSKLQRVRRAILNCCPEQFRLTGSGSQVWNYVYSEECPALVLELILWKPCVVPILTTCHRSVMVAASFYGKGRIVFVANLQILHRSDLLWGAADWVSKSKLSVPLAVDKNSVYAIKELIPRGRVVTCMDRKDVLTKCPPVFITDISVDEDYVEMMEYVKNGGGLIVGGSSRLNYDLPKEMYVYGTLKADMVDPIVKTANQIFAKVGLSFSWRNHDHQYHHARRGPDVGMWSLSVKPIPPLKCSLYLAEKYYSWMNVNQPNRLYSINSLEEEIYRNEAKVVSFRK